MLVNVSGEQFWGPVDTAVSIWVDYMWFTQISGRVLHSVETAAPVDGHQLDVVGHGELKFELWDKSFLEKVRVLRTLPNKILIERQVWRRNRL